MRLPDVLAVPRLCYLAGREYWVRPLSFEARAIILAWLDDVLPGHAERREAQRFPILSDEESRKWLVTDDGWTLQVWLALRDQGVDYQAAKMITATLDDDEKARLHTVLIERRRSFVPSEGGKDLGELWLDQKWQEWLIELGLETFGKLTLDQFEWITSGGKCDEKTEEEGFAAAMAAFNAAVAAGAEVAQPETADSQINDMILHLNALKAAQQETLAEGPNGG